MKRIVSILLLFSLSIQCLFMPSAAQAVSASSAPSAASFFYPNCMSFLADTSWSDYLSQDSNFGFSAFCQQENPTLQLASDLAFSMAAGLPPSAPATEIPTDRVAVGYAEDALLSLFAAMERGLSDDLWAQAQADAELRFIRIAPDQDAFVVVSPLMEELSTLLGNDAEINALLEQLAPALQEQPTRQGQAEYAVLSQYARTYALFRTILVSIAASSSDADLRLAAENVSGALQQCFAYKITHFSNYPDMDARAAFLLDPVLPALIEQNALTLPSLSRLCEFSTGLQACQNGAQSGGFLMDQYCCDTLFSYWCMHSMAQLRTCLLDRIDQQRQTINTQSSDTEIELLQNSLYGLLYTSLQGEWHLQQLSSQTDFPFTFTKHSTVLTGADCYTNACAAAASIQPQLRMLSAAISDTPDTVSGSTDSSTGGNAGTGSVPTLPPANSTSTDDLAFLYASYRNQIAFYETQYGTAAAVPDGDSCYYWTGLCFMKLLDFNGDQLDELLLVYPQPDAISLPTSDFPTMYTFEIWGLVDNEPALLDSDTLFGGDGGSKTLLLTEYNGRPYVLSGGGDSFLFYTIHGYREDGTYGIVKQFSFDGSDIVDREQYGLIDGSMVTEAEFKSTLALWTQQMQRYDLNFCYDISPIQTEIDLCKQELGISTP